MLLYANKSTTEHHISTRQEQLTYLRTVREQLGYKGLDMVLKSTDYGVLDITEIAYVMDESTVSIRKTEYRALQKLRIPSNGKIIKKSLIEKINFEQELIEKSLST